MPQPTRAERIAEAALAKLQSRAGFDHWWDDIAADVQNEIAASIAQAVEPHLPKVVHGDD